MNPNKIIKILTTISIITFIPLMSIASETITGKIVGFNSLIHGKDAPTGIDDPHIDLEPDFVILLSDGSHYLIPNLPMEVKKKYLYKSVKITGNINVGHRSIVAKKMKVRGKRKYKMVWTNAEQKRRQEQINRGWTTDVH
jgi:hypothetical protein